MLGEFYDRYQVPIYITENGVGHYDEIVDGEITDPYHGSFTATNIIQMKEAIQDGVDPIGFYDGVDWGQLILCPVPPAK